MGILDRIAQSLGYAKAQPVLTPGDLQSSQSAGIAYGGPINFPGWDKMPQVGNTRDSARARTAITNAWIYSGIGAIAREMGVPNIEIDIEQADGSTEEDKGHPLARVWKRPNRYMGANYLAQFWVWQRYLLGESYVFCAPDATGEIAELWPVPSQWMTPIPDKNDFIAGYAFQKSALDKPIAIPPQYVCYSRIPHPFDLLRGLSPIVASWLAITTDIAQQNWNASFFSKNNAKPAGMISVPAALSNADFERVKAEMTAFYGGTEQRTLIARAGQIDYKSLGISQRDMDFMKGRVMSREEIDRTLGIPAGYFDKGATEANARHAKAILIENVIWPTLESWAEDWTSQILPYWYGPGLVAQFEDIRPRDRAMAITETTSRMSYWTLNEIRAEEGLDPLEGEIFELLPATAALALAQQGRLDIAEPEPEVIETEKVAEPLMLTEGEGAMNDAMGATMPADETAQSEDVNAVKALHWRQWETKAIKSLKTNRSAYVRFRSDALGMTEQARALTALGEASDVEMVRDAFKAAKGEKPVKDAKEAEAIFEARAQAIRDLLASEKKGESKAKPLPEPFQELNARITKEYMAKAGAQLAAGEITPAKFEQLMRKEIKDGVTAAYRFEIKRALNDAELKRVNGIIERQQTYLSKFVGDIKSADDLAFVESRAQLYAGATSEAKAAGSVDAKEDDAEMTWSGPNGEESCPDCAELIGVTKTAAEWKASGELPGTLTCNGNCRCELS